MKNEKLRHVYDCPVVQAIELSAESTILDSSGDEGQLAPAMPFNEATDIF